MSKYYYLENNQQLGPVSLEELKAKNITKETFIWYQGMADWQKAGDLPELASLFVVATPPPPQQPPQYQPPQAAPQYQQPQAAPQQPQAQPQYQQHQHQQAAYAPAKKKSPVALIIIIVAVVLIGGVAGVYFLGGSSYTFSTYASSQGGFQIDAPDGTMTLQTQNLNLAGINATQYIHMHEASDAAFMVSHLDMPATNLSDADRNTILNESANGFVSQFGGTITSNNPVTINGYNGIHIIANGFTNGMEVISEVQLFLAGNRLFIVGTFGDKSKVKQRDIDTFLNSFAITF